jgi:hypothetical protein
MPWSDAARTGGGFGCRIGDYSVCLFELWPSEGSRSRASANYSSTLSPSPAGFQILYLLIKGGRGQLAGGFVLMLAALLAPVHPFDLL